MTSYDYRIDSRHPITNRLLPRSTPLRAYKDLSLAVAIAAKCVPNRFGEEIRVVHVPSGDIVFRVESPPAGDIETA